MEENIPTTTATKAFARDLQTMLEGAEKLLRSAGQQVRREYQAVRDQVAATVGGSLVDARDGLSAVEESVLTRSRSAFRTTDRFVQSHPWQAAIAGACFGFVLGTWMARR